MESEITLSPQQSLDLIAEAISKAKDNIRENSFGFLLWGWLIGIASVGYFILHQYTNFQYYFLPFPILAGIGIITTAIWFTRKNHKGTLAYTTYFLNKMWTVLGVSFIIVVFINVRQGNVPFTYTLLIAGIGTLVSGWVLKYKPLIIGGIFLLVSAIASIYIFDQYKPLLHGIAIVAGYLIPGYLLKNEKK